jgi:hypothetical protein
MAQLEVGELYTFKRGEPMYAFHSIISFSHPSGPNYEVDFSKPCLLLAVDTKNPNMVTLLCCDEDGNTRELFMHIRFDLPGSPQKVVST